MAFDFPEEDATPDTAYGLGRVAGYDEAMEEVAYIFSDEWLHGKIFPQYLHAIAVSRAYAVEKFLRGKEY